MPHGGVTWEPWPHEPPEGWPYSYVAEVDFVAMRRRAEQAEALLRDAIEVWNMAPAISDRRDRDNFWAFSARVAAHFDEVKP